MRGRNDVGEERLFERETDIPFKKGLRKNTELQRMLEVRPGRIRVDFVQGQGVQPMVVISPSGHVRKEIFVELHAIWLE